MATTAVATPPVHYSKANISWRLSSTDRGSPLIDRRQPSLVRRPSSRGYVTRRKSADNLRRRNSWRWSWKNVLTKSFQNLASVRATRRDKEQIPKKGPSELTKNFSNSVETREKMARITGLWDIDIVGSSDDSSDDTSDDEDDLLLRGCRRPTGPQIIRSDSSSSENEDDDAVEEEINWDVPVSSYVTDGPSRMICLTNLTDTTKRTPNVSHSYPTAENPGSTSNSGFLRSPLLQETEGADTASSVNSNPDVLTVNRDMINCGHNSSVIAPQQISGLERFGDISKQVKQSFSISCEQLSAGNHNDEEKPRQEYKPRKASHDDSRTTWRSCAGGLTEAGCSLEDSVVKTKGHRFSWPSPQEFYPNVTIETTREDFLSVSLENKNLASEKEELIKDRPNEDTSVEERQSRPQEDDQLYITSEMEDMFSTQDLNAIRRFLGMSLQQIDANKVLEDNKKKHPCLAVVSVSNLKEIGNEPHTSRDHGHVVTENKDVIPDYPSTYLQANKGGTPTKEQVISSNGDETCELYCEFRDFGCAFTRTRKVPHLENHMKSDVDEHLKLVCQTANKLKEELHDQKLLQEKQSLRIRQLTETVRKLEDLVQYQHKKRESQGKLILSLRDQVREHRKQSQRFERDVSRQLQTLNKPTSTPPMTLSPNPIIAEMLWPLKNFRKCLKRVRAGEIEDPLMSEPCYSGTSGYKLSMWVYINGRGKNLGSCVSVYARVMPGEYDAILSWPIRPMYTFTLLDQSEGEKENIVRTRKVNDIKRNGGKHNGIGRPVGGDRSVIVGFDDFITHEQLEERDYLVNDCLFLKLNAKFLN